jgi:hypothetical protein
VKPFRSFQFFVAFVATIPLLCPASVLSAAADDLAPATSIVPRESTPPAESVRPQDVRPVDVVLGFGNHISGRVTTSLDQPITGVEIVVTRWFSGEGSARRRLHARDVSFDIARASLDRCRSASDSD